RDRHIRAWDVGVVGEGDGLPLEPRNPGPNGDIGDGIVAGHIFGLTEPPVEHAPQPAGLPGIALFGVSASSGIEFHEMVNLTEERSGTPHLPHHPSYHTPLAT